MSQGVTSARFYPLFKSYSCKGLYSLPTDIVRVFQIGPKSPHGATWPIKGSAAIVQRLKQLRNDLENGITVEYDKSYKNRNDINTLLKKTL